MRAARCQRSSGSAALFLELDFYEVHHLFAEVNHIMVDARPSKIGDTCLYRYRSKGKDMGQHTDKELQPTDQIQHSQTELSGFETFWNVEAFG